MKTSWIVTAVLTAWLIAASTLCFAEELKIAAGSAPVENILKPVKNAFEEATQIQLIFLDRFLKGKRLAPDLLETTNAEEVRQNVAANPSAIGIGPAGIVDDSISSPEIPEVNREITLVASAYAPDSVRKLIDFLKSKGSEYIKQ
jgi:hypothetical protein